MIHPENLSFARNSGRFLIFSRIRNSNFFPDNLGDLSSYFLFFAISRQATADVITKLRLLDRASVKQRFCAVNSEENKSETKDYVLFSFA